MTRYWDHKEFHPETKRRYEELLTVISDGQSDSVSAEELLAKLLLHAHIIPKPKRTLIQSYFNIGDKTYQATESIDFEGTSVMRYKQSRPPKPLEAYSVDEVIDLGWLVERAPE